MDDKPLAHEPIAPELSAAISVARWVVGLAGGYAIGKGWLDQDTLNAILALAAAGLPMAWSVWKAYWHAKALKAAAGRVPDSIIQSRPATQ